MGSSEDSDARTTDPSTSARAGVHAPARWLPATIGRYRIIRLLGEGGMGVVYEAEQENPRRTVALKVIKPGLASPSLLLRFEREYSYLWLFHHRVPHDDLIPKPRVSHHF